MEYDPHNSEEYNENTDHQKIVAFQRNCRSIWELDWTYYTDPHFQPGMYMSREDFLWHPGTGVDSD